jgi:hypothetical protein
MYKWEVRNIYEESNNGCAVSRDGFKTHRLAVSDLIKDLQENNFPMLKYGLGEKERVETIITVKSYKEE